MVEGIYQHYGDLAPLDAIYDLKQRFKYRLLVDESLSFGVLGATGRGAAEHFGLEPGQVEITAASLGKCLGLWVRVTGVRVRGCRVRGLKLKGFKTVGFKFNRRQRC